MTNQVTDPFDRTAEEMIASVRDEFPRTEGLVYLDVAARSLFPRC